MENTGCRGRRLVITSTVLLLGTVSFSCCVAAEFKKSEATKDLRLDGSLCSLPRSPSFALGITALLCLSAAQIAGTSAAGFRLCDFGRTRAATSIALLVLSWLSFAVTAVLLGTASSISNRQEYGKGWMDGECYFVKDGVYIGSSVLAVATVIFILAFTFTSAAVFHGRRTGTGLELEPKDTAAARQE